MMGFVRPKRQKIREGSQSPWGRIDYIRWLCDGIASVGNPGHGGYKVYPSFNHKINPAWRNKGGWYEEDCEWAIVAYTFPEYFEKEHVECAVKTLKSYFWQQWEQVTGQEVSPEESIDKKEFLFKAANKGRLMTIAASTSDKRPGFVEVWATIDGERKTFYGPEIPEKRFYVKTEEYRQRGSLPFLIDEGRHEEIKEEKS